MTTYNKKEENIYSNTGIKTEAALVLWELVKDNPKIRNKVISVIKNYQTYYQSLKDIKNVKIRIHLHALIMQEAQMITVKVENNKINTYLNNVLQYVYRKSLESAQVDWKIHDTKKLQAAVRKTFGMKKL